MTFDMERPPELRPTSKSESYSTPKIHEYGTLRDLTKAIGNTGNLDGGTGAQKRTSP